ncbi:uncharacterized protein LOC142985655 isoform X2 [Anticarsia gemmatalis]|uniref:uncharacterized protein LOC142985655 isoform X2 n=1 Tax=Anticarsia gemmatalis TaxID=129554 RepID=UPI003F77265C
MDRMLNSKREKESIYEIYRACRLCGGGAGYKMPIIQNIVDVDDADVELKQKIRDCVQIEVHQDDKMPPLICELCVDKVNDFYEFLEMCRQTNKRTRLRLGLPPQSLPRGAPDAGDCILGLTEPVFVNEDSDGEPLAKHKKLSKNIKKEPVVRIKLENLQDERLVRSKSRREPTPPRITRHGRSRDEDLTKNEESRLKRSRESLKMDTSSKKVKITIKPMKPPPSPSPKSSPRVKPARSSKGTVVKRAPSPVREVYSCPVCGQQNKTNQARANHLRIHNVGYTSVKLACNPCGEWFVSAEDCAAHHRTHRNRPYECRRCYADFKKLTAYDEHIENKECLPLPEVPDVKCDVCWHMFATEHLLDTHRCLGEEHRPGGKCSKCNRNYALLRNLKKHETTCTARKKGEFRIDPELLALLKPIQVRVARCDPLLVNVKQEHIDVSCVSPDFGLDATCHYPYISSIRIKSELPMVSIQDDIKSEFCAQDYVHWDSDSESDDEITCQDSLNPYFKKRNIDTLAAIALKTIFSRRFLGKVPRKKRKVKVEKTFDSLVDHDDVRMDLTSLINNLGDDDDFNEKSDKCTSDYKVSDENNDSVLNNGSESVNNDRCDANNDRVSENHEGSVSNEVAKVVRNDSSDDICNSSSLISDSNLINSSKNNDSISNDNDRLSTTGNEVNDREVNNDLVNNDSVSNDNFNDLDVRVNDNDSSSAVNEVNDRDLNNDSHKINTNSSSDLQENSHSNEELKNCDDNNALTINDNHEIGSTNKDESPINENNDLIRKNNCTINTKSLLSSILNSENPSKDSVDYKNNEDSQLSRNNEVNDSNEVNDNNDSDNKLMRDLDEQIGENSNSCSDKIVLEDLINNKPHVGLGSIEDFNFDS